jgi:hypothetical protein
MMTGLDERRRVFLSPCLRGEVCGSGIALLHHSFRYFLIVFTDGRCPKRRYVTIEKVRAQYNGKGRKEWRIPYP